METENKDINPEEEMNEILNRFYSLKNEYETKYNDFKKKLLKNDTLNIKEKRKELLKYKRKCINCGNIGGTIFKIDKDFLEAKCGNVSSPCNLNIKIEKGDREYIYDELNLINASINDIKIEIITNKLNLLFQYNTEDSVLSQFKTQLSELQEFMEIYNSIITREIDITHNSKSKIELKNINIDKNELLVKIKELLENYKENDNINSLKDIVNIYKDDLYPLIKKESNIKYRHRDININDRDNTYESSSKKYDYCDLIYVWTEFKILEDSKKKSK